MEVRRAIHKHQRALDVRVDVQHGRQSERDGFTTSRLRDSNNIATAEGHWPRLALNGGRGGKTLGTNGGHDILWETNLLK